jgi:hypothetical protein
MHDGDLKVIRIGLRLVYFVVMNVEELELKTSVLYLIQNLCEMFNEA